jgi:lipopolysaccharide biosynthesis glycosyltransferase/UDP:flavonoid glycosyltransferase YjiC (YdhE family)
MARILLGWELGFGLGHIANLLPVAEALADRGHEPILVVRDVAAIWSQVRNTPFTILPAPVFFGRPHIKEAGFRSYADLLALHGYDDPEALEPMVRAWQHLIESTQPELVVAEHAPTLCLASYGRLPVVNLGTGFTVPCEQADGDFPVLNPGASSQVGMERIYSTLAQVLRRLGQTPPKPVIRAVLGDESLAIVMEEIDPYRNFRRQPALGPLWAATHSLELPETPACLIYLPASHPDMEMLLTGLIDLSMPGIAYVRDATPKIIDWLRATPLEIATRPLDLDSVLPHVSVVLHHGGVGISQHCLVAGRPQVIAPAYFEQHLNCSAMQSLGVAIRLGTTLTPLQSGLALERAARMSRLRQFAQHQAHNLKMRYARGSLNRVVETILARLQPHSFVTPPRPSGSDTIHLIHSFENVNGGSEQRTLHLYRLFRGHADVQLWCEHDPHPALMAELPIRRIGEDGVPDDGTLVFVSTYYKVGTWLDRVHPQRLIIVYNIDAPSTLIALLGRLSKPWHPKPELIYASRALSERMGLPGTIQDSPIDLARFACDREYAAAPARPCTIGRLSRDTPDKHHPEDIALYQRLAENGYHVRIMGGTILHDALAGLPGIELLAEGAEPADEFLASLDIFLYRTNENWFEAWGRVVAEAMASGLPVVCHARGGYAELIRQGENGFLYENQDQAFSIIETLRASPSLRAKVGRAAKCDAHARLGEAFEQQIRDFFIPKSQAAEPTKLSDLSCDITVFFAADRGFAAILEVALFSLLQHNRRHRLTVHLALTGVPDIQCERFKHIAQSFNARLVFHTIDLSSLPPLPTNSSIPVASYFRLLVPELVDDGAERALYLDCDLIVMADIGALWNMQLDGAVLAAVRDPGADRTNRTSLGLSAGHFYFNSGVMLIDLAAWRREKVTESAFDFVSRFPGRAARNHDQDVLNACLDGRVAYVSPRWNFMPYLSGTREHDEYADIVSGVTPPCIIHFAGKNKPWVASVPDDEWNAHYRTARDALSRLDWSAFQAPVGVQNMAPARRRKFLPTAQKFCVMTMGRSASTTLMRALEAEPDIALPNKDIYCPGNELLQPLRMSLYQNYYSTKTGLYITTPSALVDAFYSCHEQAGFVGFKSFPSRHPDFADFSLRKDVRFIALLRQDLPSAIASFMVARAHIGQWGRKGGEQSLRWRFDPELDAGSVEAKVIEVVNECLALLDLPHTICLTYEQLCDPEFANARLDEFFERPIRIAHPKPPTQAARYVTNWTEFEEFVWACAERIFPHIRTLLNDFAARAQAGAASSS